MANLNVAVIGSPGYSRELGKKGTESDVTIYNMKKVDDTLTIMEPSRYPEKLAPLSYSVFFADYAILVVEKIDASFGESLLMLDAVGPDTGVVILKNYITEEQITRYIKDTRLVDYELLEDDVIQLREKLWNLIPEDTESEITQGTVIVDHYFKVKGIGTVALGVVENGTIKKHDNLKAKPGTAVAQIRSIQKHDTDYDTATTHDRVGLALKNIETEEMDKGVVLTNDPTIQTTTEIKDTIQLNNFWLNPIKEGMPIHIGHWMQFNAARITTLENENIATITLDNPIAYRKGSKAAVTYLDGGNLRVMGTIKLN